MARALSITRRAGKDVREIWDYIATRDSAEAADHVTAEITSQFEKIADMPGIGHRRYEIKSRSYRVCSVFSYLIIYRVKGRTVFISRVVHGRRDLRRLFR
jgi:toxin ParE1/3/4